MVYCDFCGKKKMEYFYRIIGNDLTLRFACSDCKYLFDVIFREHKRKNLRAIELIWGFLDDPYYGNQKIKTEKGKKNW